MSVVTLGDLSLFHALQTYRFEAKIDLSQRVAELGTGEVADISSHLSGNFSIIADIERSLGMSESYATTITSASTFFDAQSTALGKARNGLESTGIELIDSAVSGDLTKFASVLSQGEQKFDEVVNALNSRSGGRTLFSGATTQSATFASSSEIMSAFAASLEDATTAGEVLSLADSWFGRGGEYDTLAYLGSSDDLDGFRVGPSETVSTDVSGDNKEIRDLLKFHAIYAAVSEGGITMVQSEKENLVSAIGTGILELNEELISLEARVGSIQERLSELAVENSAERFSLLSARNDLIGADPAETAMWLSEAESHLDQMYVVIARMSKLTLTSYV